MAKAGHPAAVESGARESSNPSRATADGNTPPTYSKIPDFSSQRSAPRFYPYVRLFQVAEYLGSEACQNAIIDHVRVQARKHNAVPGVQDVRRLWGDEEDAFEMKGFGEHAVHQGGLKGLTLDLYCALPTEKLVLTEEEIWYVFVSRSLRDPVGVRAYRRDRWLTEGVTIGRHGSCESFLPASRKARMTSATCHCRRSRLRSAAPRTIRTGTHRPAFRPFMSSRPPINIDHP